ncbi:MAG: hypothetical protein IAE80_07810 [Anaerolinea sp.]|nr:hypothetical protein [Anaerolinea sp.]
MDRNTIYNWTQHPELSRFFSSSARMEDGSAQRILTQSDLLVLNTIRIKRAQGVVDWKEIADALDAGERAEEFPQNALSADPRTVPMHQVEQSARALITSAERDHALAKVAELETEITRLREIEEEQRAQIAELQQALSKVEARVIREERDYRDVVVREMTSESIRLVREYEEKLSELRTQIAELKYRLGEKRADG